MSLHRLNPNGQPSSVKVASIYARPAGATTAVTKLSGSQGLVHRSPLVLIANGSSNTSLLRSWLQQAKRDVIELPHSTDNPTAILAAPAVVISHGAATSDKQLIQYLQAGGKVLVFCDEWVPYFTEVLPSGIKADKSASSGNLYFQMPDNPAQRMVIPNGATAVVYSPMPLNATTLWVDSNGKTGIAMIPVGNGKLCVIGSNLDMDNSTVPAELLAQWQQLFNSLLNA
ncbi:hypothetical protein BUE93_21870 [Chromobacterium amazonense]|uniref:Uncharacterized protein n=1 Tax=Chromobacterium amazonense TaxID=1382803 RepID=A0A2S9WYJ0_9NEIS|nr:hypothetical protein [Chromobacterium amazonense]PRP68540.1 hypothetical protein BUE93_21870 [Chromobacterium amazonense]